MPFGLGPSRFNLPKKPTLEEVDDHPDTQPTDVPQSLQPGGFAENYIQYFKKTPVRRGIGRALEVLAAALTVHGSRDPGYAAMQIIREQSARRDRRRQEIIAQTQFQTREAGIERRHREGLKATSADVETREGGAMDRLDKQVQAGVEADIRGFEAALGLKELDVKSAKEIEGMKINARKRAMLLAFVNQRALIFEGSLRGIIEDPSMVTSIVGKLSNNEYEDLTVPERAVVHEMYAKARKDALMDSAIRTQALYAGIASIPRGAVDPTTGKQPVVGYDDAQKYVDGVLLGPGINEPRRPFAGSQDEVHLTPEQIEVQARELIQAARLDTNQENMKALTTFADSHGMEEIVAATLLLDIGYPEEIVSAQYPQAMRTINANTRSRVVAPQQHALEGVKEVGKSLLDKISTGRGPFG